MEIDNEFHYRYPYAAVADLIYGKRMRYLVTFLLDPTVFGAGVPNILVGTRKRSEPNRRVSDAPELPRTRTAEYLV